MIWVALLAVGLYLYETQVVRASAPAVPGAPPLQSAAAIVAAQTGASVQAVEETQAAGAAPPGTLPTGTTSNPGAYSLATGVVQSIPVAGQIAGAVIKAAPTVLSAEQSILTSVGVVKSQAEINAEILAKDQTHFLGISSYLGTAAWLRGFVRMPDGTLPPAIWGVDSRWSNFLVQYGPPRVSDPADSLTLANAAYYAIKSGLGPAMTLIPGTTVALDPNAAPPAGKPPVATMITGVQASGAGSIVAAVPSPSSGALSEGVATPVSPTTPPDVAGDLTSLGYSQDPTNGAWVAPANL